LDIAVIGAGIAGLSCAWRLSGGRLDADDAGVPPGARVTLFEARRTAGGHTNTVDVTLDGKTHPVDTGFLVFNRRTYPGLIRLFDALGIEGTPTEMTFSARSPAAVVRSNGRETISTRSSCNGATSRCRRSGACSPTS
jgi:predicted NAD/FAD-binding protein